MLKRAWPKLATIVFHGLALFPLSVLQILGHCTGWIAWKLPGNYKRRAEQNFAQAYPDLNLSMRRSSMIEVGKLFF
ncbi:MAG: hypothetical protein ABI171_22450 [Collimonas sp.]|uniref:hypothetical protein n=1 Tax=Collimonas sp. TaxID=1963772 RepID=UPI0032659E6B